MGWTVIIKTLYSLENDAYISSKHDIGEFQSHFEHHLGFRPLQPLRAEIRLANIEIRIQWAFLLLATHVVLLSREIMWKLDFQKMRTSLRKILSVNKLLKFWRHSWKFIFNCMLFCDFTEIKPWEMFTYCKQNSFT